MFHFHPDRFKGKYHDVSGGSMGSQRSFRSFQEHFRRPKDGPKGFQRDIWRSQRKVFLGNARDFSRVPGKLRGISENLRRVLNILGAV